jgi:hypothetical protein
MRYPPRIANALRAAGPALERTRELIVEIEHFRASVAEFEAVAKQTEAILAIIVADQGAGDD